MVRPAGLRGRVNARSAAGPVPDAAGHDGRAEGVAISPVQMASVLEGFAVLVEDRLEELEEGVADGQPQEVGVRRSVVIARSRHSARDGSIPFCSRRVR